ncbi:YlbL family protein [Lacisediminihabitans changchengi]|uniref:endopeptidase La n=1 Tax=Lacisediminihabitans changchengi TaxID=2787634 RepID=A0A934SL66_9MICO|nr:S16 family serine protease [Lacisediminihabitans changchengi]MBK4347366.1 PDZ domain-containing protein [Lacisediminihabitans changchengi]
MALFADVPVDSRRPRRRGRTVGLVLLVLAIIAGIALATVPTPYVIEQPGPVFNTLGTVQNDGKAVPLIEIPGQKTYATSGALDLLTVNLLGDRQSPPSWFEVAQAWFDPSKAVVPIDSVYPEGETVEQSNKQSAVDMQNSQKDAVAAALTQLGYPLTGTLNVEGFSPDSPSKGALQNGDEILAVNGTKTDTVAGLRSVIAKTGAGVPVEVSIRRKGADSTVSVTPALSSDDGKTPILGIYPSISYTFPFEVKIQLENVGGPSAGQMFALGIIDKLTPGKLNGGAKVAGTGTIDAEGDVGPIGGIRQKLYGARDAGATYFLAPKSNCNEVTGHVPSGIRVFAVTTLDDSLAALKAIRTGASTSSLPTCPAK